MFTAAKDLFNFFRSSVTIFFREELTTDCILNSTYEKQYFHIIDPMGSISTAFCIKMLQAKYCTMHMDKKFYIGKHHNNTEESVLVNLGQFL